MDASLAGFGVWAQVGVLVQTLVRRRCLVVMLRGARSHSTVLTRSSARPPPWYYSAQRAVRPHVVFLSGSECG